MRHRLITAALAALCMAGASAPMAQPVDFVLRRG
jgi:hypothetical protein